MEAYKRVALARKKTRPTGQDFIDNLFTDFIELHGDRCFGDDPTAINSYFGEFMSQYSWAEFVTGGLTQKKQE